MAGPQKAVPGTAKIVMQFRQAGQIVQNIFHVKLEGEPVGWTEQDLDDVFLLFANWWKANIRPDTASNVVFEKVVVTDLNTLTGLSKEYAITADGNGTGVGPGNPNNVTIAVKWATLQRGRSFTGRTYHIGLLSSQVDGNKITSAYQILLRADYQALINVVDGAANLNANMVVVSRFSNKAERPVPVTTVITSAQLDENLDSQRRRLNGRGN